MWLVIYTLMLFFFLFKSNKEMRGHLILSKISVLVFDLCQMVLVTLSCPRHSLLENVPRFN